MPDGARPAAIRGTFAEVKTIKTRGVAVFCIEVQIEEANEALIALGGIPLPGKEPWVALARLNPDAVPVRAERVEKAGAAPKVDTTKPVDTSKSEAAKELYRQKDKMQQAVTRAAQLAKEKHFWDWAADTDYEVWARGIFLHAGEPSLAAAHWIRTQCGVKSRSEIGANPEAYNRFLALETDWMRASGRMAEAR